MEGGGGPPEQSPRTVAKATRSERAAPEGQSESEPEPAQEPEPTAEPMAPTAEPKQDSRAARWHHT